MTKTRDIKTEGKDMKKKKYYHMIIARNDAAAAGCAYGSTRREYISTKQGSAPAGWFCVAVCGYHEEV